MPVTEALDAWQRGIAAHEPHKVAALFTEDAIFQGLKPYTVGRDGVAAYYDSQPLGMTVDYRVITEKALGDVVVGWVEADFHFTDEDPVLLNLTVVLKDGLITHYHVSHRV
ncbi:YybH family protein [Actinoplanes sp. CA-142083]|uniref:YybH family protein n=1 Tax=Actinoplanes sp. CA-142083 TaxID=3239903 RepID=UPI003D8D5B18